MAKSKKTTKKPRAVSKRKAATTKVKPAERARTPKQASAAAKRLAPVSRSLSIDKLLTHASLTTRRLLIRGVAGSGKTTLLRWAAVAAARARNSVRDGGPTTDLFASILDRFPIRRYARHREFQYFDKRSGNWIVDKGESLHGIGGASILTADWRNTIPFFVRLRDYPDGRMPTPEQIVRSMSRALPDAPSGWADRVLREGRGLVMLDGVDEIPKQKRGRLKQDIQVFIGEFPENLYVVTTRPGAVDEAWLADLDFLVADVEPMSPADRDEMVRRWHRAMEERLRELRRPEDLRATEEKLLGILAEESSVARLAIWPLLCAVICALHRDRHGNLPKSRVELCEKLCEMLLDRRDAEQDQLESQQHLAPEYRGLSYPERKGLLSRLAHAMVTRGVSALDFDEVEREIRGERGVDPTVARILRESLVERSGLLRLAGDDQIDFLHNTLKEYLAAERFVNAGDVEVLTDHAGESNWQPVVVFAAALPRPGSTFSEALVAAILARLRKRRGPNGTQRSQKRGVAAKTSPQALKFTLMQCRAAATAIKAAMAREIEALTKDLFPPADAAAAEALAECGEGIVPYLRWRKEWTVQERAACVLALRRVGGDEARLCAEKYAGDSSPDVVLQLVLASDERGWGLTLSGKVTELDFTGTQVSDVSPLSGLAGLKALNLTSTQVSDVSPLSGLTGLEILSLNGTQVSDVSPLSGLTGLKELSLTDTQVSDTSCLSRMPALEVLELRGTRAIDLSPLSGLTALKWLVLSRTKVNDVSSITGLTELERLYLDGTLVSDVSPLAGLKALKWCFLCGTPVSDVSPLADLTRLEWLDLSDTPVTDVSSLAGLTRLRELSLHRTHVSDVSRLSRMTALQVLDIRGTKVSDCSPLAQTNYGLKIWK